MAIPVAACSFLASLGENPFFFQEPKKPDCFHQLVFRASFQSLVLVVSKFGTDHRVKSDKCLSGKQTLFFP